MKDETVEIVLEAGAEGGSLTLFRRGTPRGAFEYFTDLNAMGFEDIPGLHEQSRRVTTLEEGFALLDAAPGCDWHVLYAVKVHPDHAADVLGAVEQRMSRDGTPASDNDALRQWRRACREASGA